MELITLTIPANRSDRFIKELGEMAQEHMGLRGCDVISQSLGYSEDLEKVFFFVQIKTEDTAVELMYPDPIFDPNTREDDYDVGMVCAAFQLSDETEVRRLMQKARLLHGKTSETQEGA